MIDGLSVRIAGLDRDIRARAGERDDMRRLMTVLGIGPVCGVAVHDAVYISNNAGTAAT